jgi:hypothetical protein
MLSLSRLRSGQREWLACWRSSTSRSSAKIRPWPSRICAVSARSSGRKLRAMPQKYHIEVAVSGVMKSTTML